ncbi:hypothetical protein AAC387_Pa11g1677 [Persea americana]
MDFPAFLRSERRKTGNCSFPADLNSGKVDLQFSSALRGGNLETAALPLLLSAVKLFSQLSSALRGGKLEIADMLRVHMAQIFRSNFLSFLPFFCLLVGHGSWLRSTK